MSILLEEKKSKGKEKIIIPFDITKYIQENAVNVKPLKKEVKENQNENFDFYNLVELISEEFRGKYDDDTLTDEQKEERQQLEHLATIGDKQAEARIKAEIEQYLRKNNFLGIKFPEFYDSLENAIFQEIYKFGVFYKWEKYPHSPSAVIRGKEIWFKINGRFEKQKEELRDSQVEEIIRLLQIGNSGFKVNEANPQDEIILKNRVRIKVTIPPLSLEPTIFFRRFIVSNYSFKKQAELETIPYEDIQFYETMAKLYLNTIISGHVESGKSTLLKTFYGARDHNKEAILIESSPETFLREDFPERLVVELYTDKNGDIHKIMRDVLRMDHSYVMVQEVRGIEAEGAISATERGTRGTLITYHITEPEYTPRQLAQHIVDEFPNRNITNEVRRIANNFDIGITMGTDGNKKYLDSLYELCYDYETDQVWTNYLIKYDKNRKQWFYNPDVTPRLIQRMKEISPVLTDKFLQHLKDRAEQFELEEKERRRFIHFKG